MPLLPPKGYSCGDTQSQGALQWLRYVSETEGIYIQHAKNEGERHIGKYKVDGFCEDMRYIFEYHGCYWHGCVKCYPKGTVIHPTLMVPMSELYIKTLEKKTFLQSVDPTYSYVEMWECTWKETMRNFPAETKARITRGTSIEEQLNHRDAFFGGRTNATRLFYSVQEDEQIIYVDFCSLYPYTNKYCSYPVGHPIIITNNFKDVSEYYGLIKCSIAVINCFTPFFLIVLATS